MRSAQGMWRVNGMREADYTDVLELDLAHASSRASPAPSARRTACRCARRRRSTRRASRKWPRSATPRTRRPPAARRFRSSGGKTFEARRRRGADRRDHELHQHLESRRADRPPACSRAMRAKLGLKAQAVGQDQPRARLARRHRLPAARPGCCADSKRSASTSSATAAPPASATPARCSPRSPRRCSAGDIVARVGALGQPQLRRPRASGSQDELPRLAAAGRRVCARRHDGHRPARPSRSARAADGKPVFLARHLADATGDPATRSRTVVDSAMFKQELRERVHGRRALEGDQGAAGQDLRAGTTKSTYVRNPPYFDGMTMTPAAVADITRRARAWRCSATRSPPITSRPPATSRRRARPRSTWCRRACSRSTSIPTARAAAITK